MTITGDSAPHSKGKKEKKSKKEGKSKKDKKHKRDAVGVAQGGGDRGREENGNITKTKEKSGMVEHNENLSQERPLKKKKSSQSTSKNDQTQSMAVVGHRGLASAGPRIVKNVYTESEAVSRLSDEAIAEWRGERRTQLENCDIKPLLNFAQSGLSTDELYATRSFASPSPIQAQCLPVVLSGRDLIGIAATGSGKTLAFGLPALRHVRAQLEGGVASGKKPIVLVMAPTRELAQQIAGVLEDAGSVVGIRTLCVYGGVPKHEQTVQLKAGGIHIVVATPGRLEDIMNDRKCSLDEVSYVVLDEADRMLDLGFEPHIRKIVQATRADRQTLMFSATWPTSIRKLASDFLCNPAKVTIGSQNLAASHSVSQIVEVIEAPARDSRLDELLRKYHTSRSNRVIVFVLYKKEASKVEIMLQRKGWKAVAIHGDVSQNQRTAAVESFKAGRIPLLVATDVAARGLDIPDVEVVINYSFPLTTEDYVHRIGRTGRAGKSGIAHTLFVGAHDKPRAGELINVLREAKQTVPEALLSFGTTVKKKESKLYGAHFKDVDVTQKATKVTFDSDSE